MKSPSDAQSLLQRLERRIPFFASEDSDSENLDFEGSEELDFLTASKKRQVVAWKTLLTNHTTGKSRTNQHVRMTARKFALKVKEVAGPVTSFLCILEYSITGLPKIEYYGLYHELKAWSRRTPFPKLLKEAATKFWGSSNQVKSLGKNGPPGPPDTETAPSKDIEAELTTLLTPYKSTEIDHGLAHYSVLSQLGSSTIMFNRFEYHPEQSRPLQIAFNIPPDLLHHFFNIHKDSKLSAILTVPAEDRVASLVLSIPSTQALQEGDKLDLPVIFYSDYPFQFA
ncbi:hypothetical protein ASPCAL10281 [Aspergillus calidoustus]|uniref:Uncharacterized protein n=1 Tax=Aspergillus calidoustus TaxID=454130 RepID=A0A0U5G938_ASPCI|nr:hypothetical protein ASPCAL10281 [Aspergillus calidoustus]